MQDNDAMNAAKTAEPLNAVAMWAKIRTNLDLMSIGWLVYRSENKERVR